MKQKVLNWAKRFNTFCFLDNNEYPSGSNTIECLLGAGVKRTISINVGNALPRLEEFMAGQGSWLFGHLGYELKNEIEKLQSSNPDGLLFPDLLFFEPEILIHLTPSNIKVEGPGAPGILKEIQNESAENDQSTGGDINIQSRLTREQYISVLEKLQHHIHLRLYQH